MTDQEINEAVAKKFGWTITGECGGLKAFRNFKDTEFSEQEYIPAYCHSIEAAWEIVIWLHENGGKLLWKDYFTLMASGNGWECRMRMNPWEHADTAPMAICQAFLKLP